MRRSALTTGTLLLAMAACADEPGPTGVAPVSPAAAVSAPAAAALSLSDLRVASGRSYVVVPNGLAVGATQYVDRSYTFQGTIPAALAGRTFIRTANDDKTASAGSSSFLTFRVNQDVTVYVALDPALPVPSWMRTFTATSMTLVTSDNGKRLKVFSKRFPAGTVALGSNVDAPAMSSMYSVIVAGEGTGAVSPTLAITNLSSTSGGSYRVVANGVTRGGALYADRSYTMKGPLPATMSGRTLIRTANDDRHVGNDAWTLSFTVNTAVDVYVAHDDRTPRPAWLGAFTDTGEDLLPSFGTRFSVFRKRFAAGRVVLGSNNRPGRRNGSMYAVAVAAAAGAAPPAADSIAPTVSITAPAANSSVSGTVTIAADASDAGGLRGVRFLVNGTAIGSEDTSAPYSASWNASAVAAGTYTLAAVATDRAGNTRTASVSVSVGGGDRTPPLPTGGHHVSPTGSSAGNGSAARPWNLATALAQPGAVSAGDTIWLRGGTYRGRFVSRLTGSAARPIVVRQYPGERAIIDGPFQVYGTHTTYWGFEVIDGNGTASSETGIGVYGGAGLRFVNMLVHDNGGNGFMVSQNATGAEFYGNIVFRNGRNRTGKPFAHGIYAQNRDGMMRFVDNVLFHQLDYGFHAYAENGSIRNMHVEGNVSFHNGASQPDIMVGGGVPAQNITILRNMTWHLPLAGGSAWFGYNSSTSTDFDVRDNYFVGGGPAVRLYNINRLTFSGNTIVGSDADMGIVEQAGSTSGYTWSNNQLYGKTSHWLWFWRGRAYNRFESWKSASGLGSSDRFTEGRPTATKVFVRPNRYEPGRGHVAIYNWSRAGSVGVDLSDVLRPGQRFEIRSVQALFGAPLVSGTYGGGAVQIPMRPITPSAPGGGWRNTPPVTGPDFDTFLVVPVSR